MKKRVFNKVLNTIGKKEGISREEVEKEIQIAIDSGFGNLDPKARAEWGKVPFKEEHITAQEVFEYLCKEIKKSK